MKVEKRTILLFWGLERICCAFSPNISKQHKHRAQLLDLTFRLSMEPLAREGAWTAYLDEETTGLVYYFNNETGESSWDKPTTTFPEVKVQSTSDDRIYLGVEAQVKKKEEKLGLFDSLFRPKRQEQAYSEKNVDDGVITVEAPTKNVEKNNMFQSFFGGNKKENTKDFENKENSNQYIYEDAVITDEEPYDQALYEDAVPVEEIEQKKATFVADLMSQFKVEKRPNVPIKALELEIASKILPHPEKVSWGGEDAICINGRSFGIFDGVSGAEKLEGVPLYSNTLAQQMKSSLGSASLSIKDLKSKLLIAAEYADIAATGASTATLASIGDDNVLRVVCLGDSPLLVIRNGMIYSRTKDTLHYFDCPYQLSENSPDRPRDASVKEVKLVPGDIIIAGSDGIFDNLEDDVIIEIVSSQTGKKRASQIVEKIVSESRRISIDPNAATPYAALAKRNRYENYMSGLGGKVDDISCIVIECKES